MKYQISFAELRFGSLSDAAIRKRFSQSPMENYKKLAENGRKLKHSLRSLVNALLHITKL